MLIVIDIPEEIYNSACASNNIWNMRMAGFVCSAIANGISIPKGHGRLIDADEIEWYGCTTAFDCPHKDRECKDCNRAECSKSQVDDIPTIIEADKESEDKE